MIRIALICTLAFYNGKGINSKQDTWVIRPNFSH
jgi:hypothetical protein